MTECRKVFVDTAPFIYFLDDSPVFADIVNGVFERLLTDDIPMVTSVLTCEEYLVYPYRKNMWEKIDAFFAFARECGIPFIPVSLDIAKQAARIRADYPAFKPMDSLQLAAAVVSGCDLFLTNDNQLRQFSGLRCMTLDDWKREN